MYEELKNLAESRKAAGWLSIDSVSIKQLLALIAENEKLKVDLREVKDAKLGLSWAIGEIMGERDQLKTENEALKLQLDKAIEFQPIGEACLTNRDDLRKSLGLKRGDNLHEHVEALRKDLESHKRMLLSAAVDIGGIGEALGAEMDDDPSELQGLAAELRKDSVRLNWLDGRMKPVIENQNYGQPEGELVGYDWGVFGQCGSVREAIDDAMSKDIDQ